VLPGRPALLAAGGYWDGCVRLFSAGGRPWGRLALRLALLQH
jgi:hypothetical protein